jgi:hypothetical protein
MLNVVFLNVILNVVMLSVVRLNVVALKIESGWLTTKFLKYILQSLLRRHDIQHKGLICDTQHNDIQHK